MTDPPPGALRRLDLDDILKLLGVATAVLYGVLFIAYRRYYATLGIVPEEVGITNAYILPRTVGFVILTVLILALISALILNNFQSSSHRVLGWLQYVMSLALGGVLAYTLSRFVPESAGSVRRLSLLSAVILVAALLTVLQRSTRFPRYRLPASLAVGVIASILVPATLVVLQARSSAEAVLAGERVEPLEVLSIPILDIQAPRVAVDWADEPGKRPATIFGTVPEVPTRATGLLLGTTAETTIVLIDQDGSRGVFRINSASIVVALMP